MYLRVNKMWELQIFQVVLFLFTLTKHKQHPEREQLAGENTGTQYT